MAARAPAHISLVYPEEHDDESLLLTRTMEAASRTTRFTLTLGAISTENGGVGGVRYLVTDAFNTWSTLRAQILSAPFRMLPVEPHVTIVHPRTSNRGTEALADLSRSRIAGEVAFSEIVFTETDASGMRILNCFPLLSSTTSRMAGAVLRKEGQVLLCRRSRHRVAYPGVWDIPGGHLNPFESLEQALSRELEEELGINARIPAGGAWVTHRERDFELSVYVIDEWLGEPVNRATHEHDEIRWVSIAELPHLKLAHRSYIELLTRAMNST